MVQLRSILLCNRVFAALTHLFSFHQRYKQSNDLNLHTYGKLLYMKNCILEYLFVNRNQIIILVKILRKHDVNDLAQGCGNSSANALELPQSCTKQSIYFTVNLSFYWYYLFGLHLTLVPKPETDHKTSMHAVEVLINKPQPMRLKYKILQDLAYCNSFYVVIVPLKPYKFLSEYIISKILWMNMIRYLPVFILDFQ